MVAPLAQGCARVGLTAVNLERKTLVDDGVDVIFRGIGGFGIYSHKKPQKGMLCCVTWCGACPTASYDCTVWYVSCVCVMCVCVCVCVVSVTQKPHRCRRGHSRPAEGSARPCSPPPVAQATRAHTPTSAAHPFTRVGTEGEGWK